MVQQYEKEAEKEAQKLQESMDIEEGPLVKAGLFKTIDGDHLLLAIHHLAVDGVSWRIIFEDFVNWYRALKEGKKIILPAKTTSFKEWAEKQKEYGNSKKILNELRYWNKLCKEKLNRIPGCGGEREISIKDTTVKTVIFGKETTGKLLRETNRAYNTEINDILLAALGMAVKEWSGIDKTAIALEGHGREEIINGVDITRTVGWFTSYYPVVLDVRDSEIGTVIKRTKENLRSIPQKGVGYGILKYLTKEEYKKDMEIDIAPDISFNYLGQYDQDINNELFTYSSLSGGSNASPDFKMLCSIQINSMVKNGELHVIIDFSEKEFERETIEKLANIYENALTEIIRHCSEKKETEYTPSDYGVNEYSIEEIEEIKAHVKENIGSNVVIRKINKLTPMQEGILYTYVEQKDTSAYVIQSEFKLKGYVDIQVLNAAYNNLLNRHEALRTIIFEHWRHSSQVVLDNRELKICYEDFSRESNKDELYSRYSREKVAKGFDLSRDVLFKISLVKLEEDEFRLILTYHHIIIDGWSNAIVLNELFELYESLATGKSIQLESPCSYDGYIKWLSNQSREEGMEYWRKYLEGYSNEILLPSNETNSQEQMGRTLDTRLDIELTNRLKNIGSQNDVTFSTLCKTAWGILLQKLSNTCDVVFGEVVSGRPPEVDEIEKIVGIFLSTVPVRVKADEHKSIKQLIKELQEEQNEVRNYDYLPLAEIQNLSVLKQNLIKSLMVFENYPVDELDENINDQNKSSFIVEDVVSKEKNDYDLSVIFVLKKELTFIVMYNEGIYSTEFIKKLSMQLTMIFEKMSEDPEEAIDNIEIVSQEEKDRINSQIEEHEQEMDELSSVGFNF